VWPEVGRKDVKSLPNVKHWPLRLKIVLLLFLSSVLPLAIMGTIEFYHARDAVLHSTSALLVARGDEVAGKLDAFNDRYRRVAARLSGLPDVVRYVQSPAASRKGLAPAVQKLGESITEAAQAATQIAASSQQQMAGMDQVAQAMESIKAASAQNVASTKQTEIAAKNVGDLGQQLTELTGFESGNGI
jgi:hypothetical protein